MQYAHPGSLMTSTVASDALFVGRLCSGPDTIDGCNPIRHPIRPAFEYSENDENSTAMRFTVLGSCRPGVVVCHPLQFAIHGCFPRPIYLATTIIAKQQARPYLILI